MGLSVETLVLAKKYTDEQIKNSGGGADSADLAALKEYIDLPFEESFSDTLTLDGDSTGLTLYSSYYKILDIEIIEEDLANGGSYSLFNLSNETTQIWTFTIDDITPYLENPSILSIKGGTIVVVIEDNNFLGVDFTKGIYVDKLFYGDTALVSRITSLTINGFNKFSSRVLKEDYIPTSIVTSIDEVSQNLDNKISEVNTTISDINEEVYSIKKVFCSDEIIINNFEIGTLTAANGTNSEGTTRIRTTDYIQLRPSTSVALPDWYIEKMENYDITLRFYSEDKTYLNGSEWIKLSESPYRVNAAITAPLPVCYMRAVLRYYDSREITEDMLASVPPLKMYDDASFISREQVKEILEHESDIKNIKDAITKGVSLEESYLDVEYYRGAIGVQNGAIGENDKRLVMNDFFQNIQIIFDPSKYIIRVYNYDLDQSYPSGRASTIYTTSPIKLDDSYLYRFTIAKVSDTAFSDAEISSIQDEVYVIVKNTPTLIKKNAEAIAELQQVVSPISIILADVSTGVKYTLQINNGKLTMTEVTV